MERQELLETIYRFGIVPVIALDRVEDAVPLATALCEGGLAIAEVTYRTDCAQDVLMEMKKACPHMLVGAGTVLTKEQVDSACKAGAQFIVSPGLNPDIVSYCIKKNIPILPGVATPSDLERAIAFDLNVVKFFPAEVNGGLKAIQAMSAPYGNIKFMPTGGIQEDNLKTYLQSNKILACGGTWMVKKEYIDEKKFDLIKALSKQAVKSMLNIKIAQIGIYCGKGSEQAGDVLANATMDVKDVNDSFIKVGDITFLKDQGVSQEGHFTYTTSNVDRAVFYLQRNGVVFDFETAKYDEEHYLVQISMKEKAQKFTISLIKER